MLELKPTVAEEIDDPTEHIQALPQELQDMVFDWTMRATIDTPDSAHGKVVTIDADYKPPLALQINRKQRDISASEYYANTVFFIKGNDMHKCVNWLVTLASQHVRAINTIKYADAISTDIIEPRTYIGRRRHRFNYNAQRESSLVADSIEWRSRMILRDHARGFRSDVILVDLQYRQPDGTIVRQWYRDGHAVLEE
ncbi:hypothetical protein TI39_contig5842g00023 [Zymoseptoria brevis]|uniref:Uncharacterized protein n=1 Tax=Zymoseptoria brevis TaxID=1047168 RepID=A0A0F4G680_9PEZI|nr:hypothetical protein TI39_contig5842g00023 [Zymoseptoria brevis]